jgi:hypothetical protein
MALINPIELIDKNDVAPGPVDESKPLYFEKYPNELRESYAETRQDKMHFRLVDSQSYETRLFSKGRLDDARECCTYLLDSRTRTVTFGGNREDGCIEYSRKVSKVEGTKNETDECIMYGLKFEGRADGVKRVALALRTGAELDHGVDTAPILFRDKLWHCAIVVDPSNKHWDGVAESYYEMKEKKLRIVVENVVSGEQTQKNYSCLLPTTDPEYERARFAIMTAIQLFLGVERDLFFHLPMYVPGTTEGNATEIQNKRLGETIQKMYQGLDEMSKQTVKVWGEEDKYKQTLGSSAALAGSSPAKTK